MQSAGLGRLGIAFAKEVVAVPGHGHEYQGHYEWWAGAAHPLITRGRC